MGNRLHLPNDTILAVIGGSALVVLALVVVSTVSKFEDQAQHKFPGESFTRHLASTDGSFPSQASMIDLTDSWKFARTGSNQTPVTVLKDRTLNWKAFSVRESWKFAGEIEGHYWLRLDFFLSPTEARGAFSRPAIVLGIIPDHHRALLNGRFIGGTNYSRRLVQYNFDPAFLRKDRPNTLLIEAYSRRSMLPGITRLPDVGTFLGDFGEVERLVWNNAIRFHVFRLIYLILTLVAGLICFIYFYFHRTRKEHLYFSVYLLLGVLSLLYYNAYATITLDLQYHRFLKVFSLGLSGFVLFSTFCFLSSRRRIEYWNNIACAIFGTVIVALLVTRFLPIVDYSSRYSQLFLVSTVYGALWVIAGIGFFARDIFISRKKLEKGRGLQFATQGVILFTGGLVWSIELSSSWFGFLEYTLFERLLSHLGITHSFIFGLFVIGRMLYIQITSTTELDWEYDKQKLIADTVGTLSHSTDLLGTISVVQERFCQFIHCERSTIYLLENGQDKSQLMATYFYGDKSKTLLVRGEINPNEGLIGKVVSSKQGLLIDDIEKESAKGLKWSKDDRFYKTKSCMLLPLLVEKELIGVVTLADRKDGKSFTPKDFRLIQSASMDLAFVIKNARLRTSLKNQLEGTILALTKMIEKRDPYTEFHSQGVKYLIEKIAQQVNHPVTSELRIAALMHDVGKIFVPRRVLNKPGALRPEEQRIMEQHVKWSSDVLKSIPGFEKIAQWVELHHETLDGKGYPYNLTEDLIPIEAQIIAVADFVDALATNRAYRAKFSFDKIEGALDEMEKRGKFAKKLVLAGKKVIRSQEFRKHYSERAYSYRYEGGQDQATFDYYSVTMRDFAKSVEELRGFLKSDGRKISTEKLKRVSDILESVRQEIEKLEGTIGGAVSHPTAA